MVYLDDFYLSLGIFNRRQTDDFFLFFYIIFPRRLALAFHADCLQRRQFARNVKPIFWIKYAKIFQIVVCRNFYPVCQAIADDNILNLPVGDEK